MAFASVSFSYSGKKEAGGRKGLATTRPWPKQAVLRLVQGFEIGTNWVIPVHLSWEEDHLYEKLELGVDLDSRIALVGTGLRVSELGCALGALGALHLRSLSVLRTQRRRQVHPSEAA